MLTGGSGRGGFGAARNSLALGSVSSGGGSDVISNGGFHLGSFGSMSKGGFHLDSLGSVLSGGGSDVISNRGFHLGSFVSGLNEGGSGMISNEVPLGFARFGVVCRWQMEQGVVISLM